MGRIGIDVIVENVHRRGSVGGEGGNIVSEDGWGEAGYGEIRKQVGEDGFNLQTCRSPIASGGRD